MKALVSLREGDPVEIEVTNVTIPGRPDLPLIAHQSVRPGGVLDPEWTTISHLPTGCAIIEARGDTQAALFAAEMRLNSVGKRELQRLIKRYPEINKTAAGQKSQP